MATSTSEAMARNTVKRLNWNRMTEATSAWPTRKASASRAVTWPDGIGRERVRATFMSMSRSTMSLKVQPAPRINSAPTNISTAAIQSKPRSG